MKIFIWLFIDKVRLYSGMKSPTFSKPHTIQHKSAKGMIIWEWISIEISIVKSEGLENHNHRNLEKEDFKYKYKEFNDNKKNEHQSIYLEDEGSFDNELLMEDYDDQVSYLNLDDLYVIDRDLCLSLIVGVANDHFWLLCYF